MELYYAAKLIFVALLFQSRAGAISPRMKRAALCTTTPNSCQNGGTCTINPQGGFQCNCQFGWAGDTCRTHDFCIFNDCMNGATCVTSGSDYTCTCPAAFQGPYCEARATSGCTPNPCQNSGACYPGDTRGSFTCSCRRGYSGNQCQVDVNECSPKPCQNGGTCVQVTPPPTFGVLYNCACAVGYGGINCLQLIADGCQLAPCHNGGSCTSLSGGSFLCTCTASYTGLTCGTLRSPCDGNICQNGATCLPSGRTYTCQCPAGYVGSFCERRRSGCASSPCRNGGACVDQGTTYSCRCTAGFTGPLCSTPACPPLLSASIICPSYSAPDFRGVTSSTLNQVCARASDFLNCTKMATTGCSNDVGRSVWGVVQDSVNSCCLKSGPTAACPLPVTSCSQRPCMMNGNCTDASPGVFRCSCVSGLMGDRCETDIDECDSSPCVATSTCQNLLNKYRCLCQPGLCGSLCDIQSYNCTRAELVADPCDCDYFMTCTGAGLQPVRTRCPQDPLGIQLLFSSVSRVCGYPSSFQGSPAVYKLASGCRLP